MGGNIVDVSPVHSGLAERQLHDQRDGIFLRRRVAESVSIETHPHNFGIDSRTAPEGKIQFLDDPAEAGGKKSDREKG